MPLFFLSHTETIFKKAQDRVSNLSKSECCHMSSHKQVHDVKLSTIYYNYVLNAFLTEPCTSLILQSSLATENILR